MAKGSTRKQAKKRQKPAIYHAANADKYVLYQASVQEPEHEVEFFEQAYLESYGRQPKVLREDFCGTFAVCCEWVKKRGRTAVGVDLDPEPLDWGRKHNLAKLPAEAQSRVTLLQADVRKVHPVKADVLAAQNFSFWIFKTRAEVLAYFKAARKNLSEQGVFLLDMMGGGDCYIEGNKDRRAIGRGAKRFTYVWEQSTYNPINHDASFYIHFQFANGTKLHRAFEYHWRFWTMPEVKELLEEAGFSKVHVYWEGTTKSGAGDNNWKRAKIAPSDPCWLAYVVAER